VNQHEGDRQMHSWAILGGEKKKRGRTAVRRFKPSKKASGSVKTAGPRKKEGGDEPAGQPDKEKQRKDEVGWKKKERCKRIKNVRERYGLKASSWRSIITHGLYRGRREDRVRKKTGLTKTVWEKRGGKER